MSRIENFEPVIEPVKGREEQALPQELQPSRKQIEPLAIANPVLYKIAYEKGADLPHHGVLHGEETAILVAVLVNAAYQDVLKRGGKEMADVFRARIDEKVLLLAAAYHDCGRITDWGFHTGEMHKHGPRGADILLEKGKELDETLRELSDEQMEMLSKLVRFHTSTKQEAKERMKDHMLDRLRIPPSNSRAARKAEKEKNFEDYTDPEELMLRLLQEADKLGLPRGYYSRNPDSMKRTPFATLTSAARVFKSYQPWLRNGTSFVERDLRFPITKKLGLYQVADGLTKMSRRDPEIDKKYADVPHRQGAALEAGEKGGILKP